MKTETAIIIPTAKDIADRCRACGVELVTLAQDVARAVDTRPEIIEELKEEGISRDLILRLERLGRGQIDASLALSTSPATPKLLTCALSEQRAAIQNGVEVLDPDEETTRNIPVHELTGKQASQVFGNGRIRSLAEQRTYIREKKAVVLPTSHGPDYQVGKDFVVTKAPGKWTKGLILQWLAEMK